MPATAVCIFCKREMLLSHFNREHILPQAFGHFKHALTLASPHFYRVCSSCNASLGKAVDLPLGRGAYESILRAHHGLGNQDPSISLLQNRFTVELPAEHPLAPLYLQLSIGNPGPGYGAVPLPQVRVTYLNGQRRAILEEDIADTLPSILDALDKSKTFVYWPATDPNANERMIRLLDQNGLSLTTWSPDPELAALTAGEVPVLLTSVIDAQLMRGIAKIAFEYFAWHVQGVSRSLLQEARLEPLRSFIISGEGSWRDFVLLSDDPILANESGHMRRTQGHLLALDWSRAAGSAVQVSLTLFNEIVYTVLVLPLPRSLWVDIGSGHHYDVTAWEVRKLLRGRYILPPPSLI